MSEAPVNDQVGWSDAVGCLAFAVADLVLFVAVALLATAYGGWVAFLSLWLLGMAAVGSWLLFRRLRRR